MFGGSLGVAEIAVIVALAAVLLFLPKQIPQIARSLGDGLREWREVRKEVHDTTADAERAVRDTIR